MYYSISERGFLYFTFSLVGFFVYNETMAYYLHRLFHKPWLYKKIHKMHHRYHQPTAWSAVAMHPLEFIMYQGYLAATPFLVPIHVCKSSQEVNDICVGLVFITTVTDVK